MLWMSCFLTVLGKAPWTSRNNATATFPDRQVSLTLWIRVWIASVVLHPGRPPNWFGGSMECFSPKKERSAATSVEKTFPIVFRRPIGQ